MTAETPGHDSCGCPETDGKTYHQRGTCTDPVVDALDWYATGHPKPAVTPGPADPWRVIGELRSILFQGGQTAQFVRGQAIGALEAYGIAWNAELPAAQDARPAPMCPGGCGCRLGTDDYDKRECVCHGACTDGIDWEADETPTAEPKAAPELAVGKKPEVGELTIAICEIPGHAPHAARITVDYGLQVTSFCLPQEHAAFLGDALASKKPVAVIAEIDPAKLDLLADWFDNDDAIRGRLGNPEVQADLRRWAKLVRTLRERAELPS